MSDEKRPVKTLLLEDSFEDAELVQRRLANIGLVLNIKHVVNRSEFTDALDNFNPDLVISDYKLPDLDGLSAFRLARQRYPQIPFIILSGLIDDKFAAQTLEEGVTDFILKDRPERLGSAVRRAVQEAEQRRLEEEFSQRAQQLEAEKTELHRRESRVKQLRQELLALRDQLRKFE